MHPNKFSCEAVTLILLDENALGNKIRPKHQRRQTCVLRKVEHMFGNSNCRNPVIQTERNHLQFQDVGKPSGRKNKRSKNRKGEKPDVIAYPLCFNNSCRPWFLNTWCFSKHVTVRSAARPVNCDAE